MRELQPFNPTKQKKIDLQRVITLVCVSIAVLALTISFFVFLNDTDAKAAQSEQATEEETVAPILYSPESPKSLEYKSLGNGSCAIVSIGRYVGSELIIPERAPSGEIVSEIGMKAFYGCEYLVSVSIPGTVTKIGEQAFRDCSSLAQISVDMSNAKYSSADGILYSKDKSRLICCPTQYDSSSYRLDKRVKIISDYAFYGVENLSRVYYTGSTSDFESIKIGKGNEDFTALPITCNYSGGK